MFPFGTTVFEEDDPPPAGLILMTELDASLLLDELPLFANGRVRLL